MNYGEENNKPHALTSINGTIPNNLPIAKQIITYTDFKKVKSISEPDSEKYYEITYGVDDQRRKSVYSINDTPQETRYYFGDYEEKINHTTGITEKIHYLSGAIYIQRSNGINNFYYAYTDYLGSLICLTDEDGNPEEYYAYDPWGKRRNPYDWTESPTEGDLVGFIINRGYTGHEHIDAFGLINMNGRVYDPLTAQFLSPDPFISMPDDWLNYNRYSYCLNNPFKYTDPSGYIQWYVSGGFGWSYKSGLTVSISGGIGNQGILSIGISIGYGFRNNNFFVTANAGVVGINGYIGYDTKAGLIMGAGWSPWGFIYGKSPVSITSNMLEIGVSYSQNGGVSANVCGYVFSNGGVVFDPGLSASYTYNRKTERSSDTKPAAMPLTAEQQQMLQQAIKELVANMIPDAELVAPKAPIANLQIEPTIDLPEVVVLGSKAVLKATVTNIPPRLIIHWDTNGDGRLSKAEADNHWLYGNGEEITINGNLINLRGLNMNKARHDPTTGIFSYETIDAFIDLPFETAATYGGFTFRMVNGRPQMQSEWYHYDMRPNNAIGNRIRNVMTNFGMPTIPPGVTPRRFWMKIIY